LDPRRGRHGLRVGTVPVGEGCGGEGGKGAMIVGEGDGGEGEGSKGTVPVGKGGSGEGGKGAMIVGESDGGEGEGSEGTVPVGEGDGNGVSVHVDENIALGAGAALLSQIAVMALYINK
jgi:hypothetical protein